MGAHLYHLNFIWKNFEQNRRTFFSTNHYHHHHHPPPPPSVRHNKRALRPGTPRLERTRKSGLRLFYFLFFFFFFFTFSFFLFLFLFSFSFSFCFSFYLFFFFEIGYFYNKTRQYAPPTTIEHAIRETSPWVETRNLRGKVKQHSNKWNPLD